MEEKLEDLPLDVLLTNAEEAMQELDDAELYLCAEEMIERLRELSGALEPLQRKGLRRTLVLNAHAIDIVVRKDGADHRFEGDFLKAVARALPEEP